MKKRDASIQNRLNMLLIVCLIPLTVMILYLVIIMQRFSARYDEEQITRRGQNSCRSQRFRQFQPGLVLIQGWECLS